jgi:hypothetical protein
MIAGRLPRRRRAIYIGGAVGIIVAGVVVAAIALGASMSSRHDTRPSSEDVVATRAYLRAREELAVANIDGLSNIQMAMNTYVTAVSLPCHGLLDTLSRTGPIVDKPGGVRYSLNQARTNEALIVTASGLTIAAQRAQVGAITKFADAVGSLRWSSAEVSRLVQRYAESEQFGASLDVPPVCRNLSSWVARGFSGTPESNTPAAAKSESISEQLGKEIRAAGYSASSASRPNQTVLKILARYEGPSERIASRRLAVLEAKSNAAGLEAWTEALTKLEHELGVHSHGETQDAPTSTGADSH